MNYKYILLMLATIAIWGSCSKPENTNNDGKANITLKLTQVALNSSSVPTPFTINANDNSHYFPIDDTQASTLYIWPTKVKYYISNVRLQSHDGTLATITGKNFLAIWDSTTSSLRFSLGKVDPAHYHFILFDIGVDSTFNHADPTAVPSDSPLSLMYPGTSDMHWDWNNGYKFLVFEGKADTTGGQASWSKNLTYHLGTDALRTTITLPLSLEAQPNTNDTVAITVNNAKLFTGINVRTENHTETMDNMTLAQKVAANLQSAFTVGF